MNDYDVTTRPWKFIKKPVEIEAMVFTGANFKEVKKFVGDTIDESIDKGSLVITTLEGNMKVKKGDWVLKGVHGEFYPCKPDIFKETYTAVIVNPNPCLNCGLSVAEKSACCGCSKKFEWDKTNHPYKPSEI